MTFDPDAKRVVDTDWSSENYIDRVDELEQWAKDIGAIKRLTGRFLAYKTSFQDHINWLSRSDQAQYPHTDMVRILNAKLEVHEVDRVKRAFLDRPFPSLKSRIRTVLAGPEHYRDEQKENVATQKARNALVELATGAYLIAEGHTVLYGGPDYPEPMLRFKGKHFAFQCKRISSNNRQTIDKKIKRASEQILENIRVHSGVCSTGVILLDITKLVNPQGMVLMLRRVEDMEHSQARYDMLRFYDKFVAGLDFKKHDHVSQIIVTSSFLTTQDSTRPNESYYSYKMMMNHPNFYESFASGGSNSISKSLLPETMLDSET